MNRNFQRALSLVLKHEGGFADHPADPGGATNKGVTIATFRRYVKPGGTVADLKKITNEQVATIYRRQYWDAVHGAELPDGVDYAVFDFAVNSGPSRAAKYLQAVVGAVQDGRIGPATLAAVRTVPRVKIIHDLANRRMAFLKRLSTWKTFGRGWERRVSDVRAAALEMASTPIQTPTHPPVVAPQPPAKPAPAPQPSPAPAQGGFWAWLFSFFTRKEPIMAQKQQFLGPIGGLITGKAIETVIGAALDRVAANPRLSLEPRDVPATKEIVAAGVEREIQSRVDHVTNNEAWYQKRSRWSAIISGVIVVIGAPLARYTGLEIGAAETELIATGLSMIGGLVAGYLAYRAGTASKPLGE